MRCVWVGVAGMEANVGTDKWSGCCISLLIVVLIILLILVRVL